jgi:hypothetical protein
MRQTENENHELTQHRFFAGDKIRLNVPKRFTNAASGTYNIVRLLPEREGELQYQIKSDLEGYERVVKESQIEKA